jgi:hypothetical protein
MKTDQYYLDWWEALTPNEKQFFTQHYVHPKRSYKSLTREEKLKILKSI